MLIMETVTKVLRKQNITDYEISVKHSGEILVSLPDKQKEKEINLMIENERLIKILSYRVRAKFKTWKNFAKYLNKSNRMKLSILNKYNALNDYLIPLGYKVELKDLQKKQF